ncbi:MAG: putative toxin-antitoxin system toxin component, PIN family [Pirellulaceae bacterium]
MTDEIPRVVVDTNVLVGSAYNPRSASRTIVTACQRGDLQLFASPATLREYELILPRAIRNRQQRDQLLDLVYQACQVQPRATPRVVPGDPQDDKFVAVAVAASAVALVTNDQAVLDVGSYQGIAMLRPSAFLESHQADLAN